MKIYLVNRFGQNNNNIHYVGIDMNGTGVIIKENDDILVVKWPGGMSWVGRGMPQRYTCGEIHVLQKPKDGTNKHSLLISWDNTNRKKNQ